MYAIVRTGGKQYRVQPGDVIRVEKLDQALGSEFELTDVLMIGGEAPAVGQPVVKDAKVTVVVTKQTKDRKVIIFKKRRRQGYRRFKTHRQPFTELFVKAIKHGSQVAKTDDKANVVDVDKVRLEKIQGRMEAKKARLENRGQEGEEKPQRKAKPAVKAAGKKKAAPKKKAGAKKSVKKKK